MDYFHEPSRRTPRHPEQLELLTWPFARPGTHLCGQFIAEIEERVRPEREDEFCALKRGEY